MPRRRTGRSRRSRRGGVRKLFRRLLLGLAAVPIIYLSAALLGSLIPVNGGWTEPDEGITVYLANNGVHADILIPARSQGLDLEELFPKPQFGAPDPAADWLAFGSGEENVYLDTPRWSDITLPTIWSALTGGTRVMHVEWIRDPSYADRAIRLRPAEYRRLRAAILADFRRGPEGKPLRVDHPGYNRSDAFYWSSAGRFSALSTCNSWVADKLRLARVETSVWPPFVQGLVWRYRKADQST